MAIPEIDVDDLEPRLVAGAALIDVRQPEEFAQARLADAQLIPLAELPDRLDALPDGVPLVLMCRSGARSLRACEFLAAEGHDVVNLRGGIVAWIESGRPVASGAADG